MRISSVSLILLGFLAQRGAAYNIAFFMSVYGFSPPEKDCTLRDVTDADLTQLSKTSVPAAHLLNISCQCIYDYPPPHKYCTLYEVTEADLNQLSKKSVPATYHLELANATLERIDESLFQIFSAEHLSFSGGTVREITFRSDKLTGLRVTDTGLRRFEVTEEENYALKLLMIRSVLFKEISPSIRFLRGLDNLDLSRCGLRTVNLDDFAMMDSLVILDLSYNKIFTITGTVNLAARGMYLDHNQLTEIPRFPEGFPSLWSVSLARNQWNCEWLTAARTAILQREMILPKKDRSVCSEGMTNIGGLCCRKRPAVGSLFESKILKKGIDTEPQEYNVTVGDENLGQSSSEQSDD